MAKLEIPARYFAGVEKIRTLDDAAVSEIRSKLEHAQPGMGLGATIGEAVPDKQIGEALVGLYITKASREISAADFSEDVCDAIGSDKLPPSSSDRDKLKANLTKLMAIKEIDLKAKAADLQTENERTFCDARILTDLRPIFGANVSTGPGGIVIVHLLKLGFHESSKHEEFYVALDAEDLITLRKIIDRAEEKAKILKSTIGNFRYLGRS